MDSLAIVSELVRHGDHANALVMNQLCKLSPQQLDQPLDLGMGSVRKICQHLLAGEVTWLARANGNVEAKWPASPIPDGPADMLGIFEKMAADRRNFLAKLKPEQLERVQRYRDSKGSLFEAPLHAMLLQMITHAAHHRAQAVNAIRRVGGTPPEVDYMYEVRMPA